MTNRLVKTTCYLLGCCLVLLAGLLAWLVSKGDGPDESPSAEISFTGPSTFVTTPDSTRANPLNAPHPHFASFAISVKPEASLKPGGGIRIEQGYLFRDRALWGEDVRYAFPDPDIRDGDAPNALRVEAEGAPFELDSPPCGFGRHSCRVIFPDGLSAQRSVTFHFGDTSRGGPGLAVPTYPLKIRFLTFLDPDGDGRYVLARGDHPEIEALASNADRFRLTGPSVTYSNRIRLRIVPVRGRPGRERSELPVRDFEGEVYLLFKDKSELATAEVTFQKGDRFKDVDLMLPGPGSFRIIAHSRKGDVSGESNTIHYIDQDEDSLPAAFLHGRRIFWGSLQNHTAVGGHAASHWEEAFRCARGEGALDFCAMTDHSSNPSFHWEELRTLPDRFDEAGRFAAFAGYEWTSGIYGHRHVVFKEGKKTYACSELPTDDPFERHAPDLGALAELAGRDPNALIIMHHTRRVLDKNVSQYVFGKPADLPRQILFEIFSWQGSGEGGVEDLPIHGREDKTLGQGSGFREALRRGYRYGVTADSDQHIGLPGIPVSIRRKNGLRYGYSGLTAVLAETLDREGIFRALEARRCYGTTGARILLLFRAGGGDMGREVVLRDEAVRIQAFAAGTAPIKTIQVVSDGEGVIHEVRSPGLEASLDFMVPSSDEETGRSFYLRLEQEDGHLAWSSPIWVDQKDQGADF